MARSQKIIVLGVDGMDPRLTRKYVDMGIMPNVKRYIEAGAQRHDLVMLGGAPTVTPPMWTTLATGAYANVHGITGFSRHTPSNPGELSYNIDSRLCEAEQLWNVTAEAGLKTLVWHWPGSAWPPSSDSENLLVVDGTSPGSVGMSVNQCEKDFLVVADVNNTEATFVTEQSTGASKACIIEDLDLDDEEGGEQKKPQKPNPIKVITKFEETCGYATELYIDRQLSPIKDASGWAAAPEGAKEFIVLPSNGLLRRPALILKNEQGIYDSVAIYKSKKAEEPLAVLKVGVPVVQVVDEIIKDGQKMPMCNRNLLLVELAEDGSNLKLYASPAMDMTNDSVWHPKRILKDVSENVGFAPPTTVLGAQSDLLINKIMLPMWDITANWQADAILHLIESEDLDVIFSHYHAVDIEEHNFIRRMAPLPTAKVTPDQAEKWMRDLYVQTDNYLGRFLHLLDEGWTVFIVSDHAQVAPKNGIELLFDMTGLCTPIMQELGYTVLKKDKDGHDLHEIDWTKTRAYIEREGHLYLNLKGRDKHIVDGVEIDGIVDPADQYELEEQIMTDLYGYKSKITGHRIVSVALRNRDAVLLGQGGPQAGDICCWMAEGYNADHADCLSTTYGEYDTSVSPIFIAAGKGLKKGFETNRIIRQVDMAATIAVLAGVRQAAQCEGAPVYPIFEEPVID